MRCSLRSSAAGPRRTAITLVADGLTGIMLLLSGITGLLSTVYAGSSLRHAPRRGASPTLNQTREVLGTQALLQFLLMGVNMSFFNRRPFQPVRLV